MRSAVRRASISARYAGAGADDTANNAKLLRALPGIPMERRQARYRCALVFVSRRTIPRRSRLKVCGRDSYSTRRAAAGGFGYDPYFWLPDLKLTAAELDSGVQEPA